MTHRGGVDVPPLGKEKRMRENGQKLRGRVERSNTAAGNDINLRDVKGVKNKRKLPEKRARGMEQGDKK